MSISELPSALSRRRLFGITAGTAATLTAGAAPAPAQTATPALDPEASWAKLAAGNARFVSGQQTHPHQTLQWRESLANGQHPFAVILGCADSRVPPELVFDHGLGDLFTIRAAGEVLDNSVIGSIEYAVDHLGVPLVVVLGHANCGAVGATIEVLHGGGHVSGDVSMLVRTIEPAVLSTPHDSDPKAFLAAAVNNQAKRTAALLKERSAVIDEAVAHRGLKVVAASYELTTGKATRLT